MVSDTGKTRRRRHRKQAKAGKDRKRALESNGTTPAFPIHQDAAEHQSRDKAAASPAS